MRRAGSRLLGLAVAGTAIAVGLTTAASAANTWTVQSVPFPTTALRSADLVGVSCTSAASCEAVFTTDAAEPQAAKWNGTQWKLQTLPAREDQYPSSVSCAAATTCVAVGGGFADWWNGTTWLAMASQGGAGVSCPSVRYCVAVGSQESGDTPQPYAAKWNGTIWKDMTVPPITGEGGGLNSISCTGITSCIAVGQTSFGPVAPIAYSWNGTAWTQ